MPKPVWGDLAIAKPAGASSGVLWKWTATGKHIAAAKLELLAPGADAPYAA